MNEPPAVPIPGPLVPARFLERPNRFRVHARLESDGTRVAAHLPDPGRLAGLLIPGARLWLQPAPAGSRRRTAWTSRLLDAPDGRRISVDTTLPNVLVAAALSAGALPELGRWDRWRSEPRIGRSRFDFLLESAGAPGERLWLEVKSVSWLQGDLALFPDAVSARAARHATELSRLADRGDQAVILFLVQRPEARAVAPAARLDPDFAEALARAGRRGVRLLARRCHVRADHLRLGGSLPVLAMYT